jgi:hypothetical protein
MQVTTKGNHQVTGVKSQGNSSSINPDDDDLHSNIKGHESKKEKSFFRNKQKTKRKGSYDAASQIPTSNYEKTSYDEDDDDGDLYLMMYRQNLIKQQMIREGTFKFKRGKSLKEDSQESNTASAMSKVSAIQSFLFDQINSNTFLNSVNQVTQNKSIPVRKPLEQVVKELVVAPNAPSFGFSTEGSHSISY